MAAPEARAERVAALLADLKRFGVPEESHRRIVRNDPVIKAIDEGIKT